MIQNISNLNGQKSSGTYMQRNKNIIAVGTTSMRVLESIYWYGVQMLSSGNEIFKIEKLYPYIFSNRELPERIVCLENILNFMEKENLEKITGETEIFILPGYKFKICKGLITNYHLPKSTLLLLVSAFLGPDWKKIYLEALENKYRFLSYGDASLLIP